MDHLAHTSVKTIAALLLSMFAAACGVNDSSARNRVGWQSPSPPSTTAVIGGETQVVAARPYGPDSFGGGDAQFDAIVDYYLGDADGDGNQEIKSTLRPIAHEMCARYERGYDLVAGGEGAESHNLGWSHFAAAELGAVYAYCPEHIEAMALGGAG